MALEITEFKQRLKEQIALGQTEAELAEFILQEIRLVEGMKASLMEEMKESTKDFLNEAAARIDSYLYQLQEIEKNLHRQNLSLDQQVALNDTEMRRQFRKEMQQLHDLDPEKYPEDDPAANENHSEDSIP